ncbi:MAG: hypothetical protein CM1200mP1_06610 [Candidatus Neomarinimicrobiota bacterium]|nr:MAG: hypothetical protein CM1200mP1_06610 [Candidatus Neomarinimicrobiota bacterium]
MLTNLSTEQLVGLNGAVFGDKALVGLLGKPGCICNDCKGLVFLPDTCQWFTTTPAFLEKRFERLLDQWSQAYFYLDM